MRQTVAERISNRSPHGIAAGIASLINSGELAPGERLPTVRELALDLGVSPATVSAAWQRLSGLGLIISRGRSGSFVRATNRQWMPPRFRPLARQSDATRLDLSTGTPDAQLLPPLDHALSRISPGAATSSYLDRPVIDELDQLLRKQWPYPVESLTVVDGALDGISRALDSILRFGDGVIAEDPGFPPVFDLLDHLGGVRLPVGLDHEGIVVDDLAHALNHHPRVLVLQPRAQNPTGISMSHRRAEQLARVIGGHPNGEELIIIEDDHSGSISSSPLISLAEWLPQQVLHLRSFSKSHGPDLRIAALAGPPRLVDPIVSRRILGPGWTSRMIQQLLYELLSRAESITQVARARREYRNRQQNLVSTLQHAGVPINRPGDGLNLWLPVGNERSAVVQLAASGIKVAAGSAFQAEAGEPGEFIRISLGQLRGDVSEIGGLIADAAR